MGAFLVSTDLLGCITPVILFFAALLMHVVDLFFNCSWRMRDLPLYTLGYSQVFTAFSVEKVNKAVKVRSASVSHLVLRNFCMLFTLQLFSQSSCVSISILQTTQLSKKPKIILDIAFFPHPGWGWQVYGPFLPGHIH